MTREDGLAFINVTCENLLDVDATPLNKFNPQPNHLLFNVRAQLYLYREITRKVGRFPLDEWLIGGGFSDMKGLLDWMVKTTEKQAVPASA